MSRSREREDEEPTKVYIGVPKKLLELLVRGDDDQVGKALVKEEIRPHIQEIMWKLLDAGLLSREDLPVDVFVKGDVTIEEPGELTSWVERKVSKPGRRTNGV